jgi:hypothetical protein
MTRSVKKGQTAQLSAELRALKQAVAAAASSSKQKALKVSKKQGIKKLMSAGKISSIGNEMSVARSISQKNPTQFNVGSAPSHRDFGNGVRITGRQYLCPLTTAAASPAIFGSGQATTGANIYKLSPDSLNGRVALMARNYTRFAFRKVRLIYTPDCSNVTAGSVAVGYSNDPETNSFSSPDFSTVQSMTPALLTAYREPAFLDVRYTGDLTWFSEIDPATSASQRQTYQGEFIAFGSGNYGSVANLGQFWIEYVLDLYGNSLDYGYSVAVTNTTEKALVEKYLQRLRITDDDRESSADAEDWDKLKRKSVHFKP